MLKTESTVIDGITYSLTQLPAMRAMRLFARVARVLGPALGKLGTVGQKTGGVTDEVLGSAIELLFEKLSPDEFEFVLTEFFWALKKGDGSGMVNLAPKTGQFDLEMTGQLITIIQLLKFAFGLNFGNFSDAARKMLPTLAAENR